MESYDGMFLGKSLRYPGISKGQNMIDAEKTLHDLPLQSDRETRFAKKQD